MLGLQRMDRPSNAWVHLASLDASESFFAHILPSRRELVTGKTKNIRHIHNEAASTRRNHMLSCLNLDFTPRSAFLPCSWQRETLWRREDPGVPLRSRVMNSIFHSEHRL